MPERTEFEHCQHEIRCDSIVEIGGGVRTHWRCSLCRAQGIVDLPAERKAEVTPAFIVALSEAVLAARRAQTEDERRRIAECAVAEYKRSLWSMERQDERQRRSRSGKVYAVRNQRTGMIKIGFSTDPLNRLATLQVGCHDPLQLLAATPNADESEIHRRFDSARVTGEWFRPTPEVLAWAEEAKRA